MLIRNKRFKKFLAVFFLMTLVYEIGFPVAAYALTAGPTAPEASSFEPVDTTDMVNLATGDFTYNSPLVEVPGPEGGYPLALSYHAGIQTNEDASWVGLGWTLNPGAITRTINGYADDWNNTSINKRDYWSGGTVRSFGVDIGVGLGPASVSAGVNWTSHNGEGFSVSMDKLDVSVGQSLVSLPGGAGSIGLSANLMSGDVAANLKLNNSLGFSLDTKGNGGVGGNSFFGMSSVSSFVNTKAGKISSERNGWGMGFNFGLFNLGLKSTYYRYWSDQSTSVSTFGALNTGSALNRTDFTTTAFDSYFMPDENLNLFSSPDLEFQAGGALPDFDSYMVNAQGLNGVMRPYLYRANVGGLSRANKITGNNYVVYGDGGPLQEKITPLTYKVASSILGANNPVANFRFVNDFSNTFQQQLTNFTDGSLSATIDGNPITGDGLISGYDEGNNFLEGTRHIEYFTNADISSTASDSKAKRKGFINVAPEDAKGFNAARTTYPNAIGGFSITNSDGVTYHFALPVYNKSEFTYTEQIKLQESDPSRWTKEGKPNGAYAYAWYLTSITGPDFVDKDGNGLANDGDYGYWVNFGYGMWTDRYTWRNPSEGYNRDVDNDFQNFSQGQKELYYLNKIKTRTHTALFEKDIRYDGRGAGMSWLSAYQSTTPYQGSFTAGSEQTLRLKRILLLNNADANSIDFTAGSGLDADGMGDNVFDSYDLFNKQIESKCIKIISFQHDYSLCPNTPSSFTDANPDVKLGKLTLNSLSILGKGGVAMLPPTDFTYELPVEQYMKMSGPIVTNTNGYTITINTNPYPNDPDPGKSFLSLYNLVSVNISNGTTYTGYIADIGRIQNNAFRIVVEIVGAMPSSYTGWADLTITKNPGYEREAYDRWGMYKCDADGTELFYNSNAGRMTSFISALHVDAWSLRKISTALGGDIEIEYESDNYSQAAIPGKTSLAATDFIEDIPTQQVTFKVSNPTRNSLSSMFPVGSKIDMKVLYRGYKAPSGPDMISPLILSTAQDNITYFSSTTQNYNRTRVPLTIPTTGNFTVKSINESAGTVTVNWMDPFLFGTTNKTISFANGSTDIIRIGGGILAGNLSYYNYGSSVVYGGGLRVRRLRVKDEERTAISQYVYAIPGGGNSSGVTSYEPNSMEGVAFTNTAYSYFAGSNEVKGRFKGEFRNMLNPNYGKVLALARTLPAPGVFYEYVTTSAAVTDISTISTPSIPGKTTYQFVVPFADMVTYTLNGGYNSSSIRTKNYSIVDKSAAVGSLKRTVTYDSRGNKLTEVINTTAIDETSTPGRVTRYKKQGEVTERFVGAKQFEDELGLNRNVAIMTARTEKPNMPTGKTVINYMDNTRTFTDYLAYDFYSGALTQKVETDVYGNKFRTDIIPAYRKYVEMGPKVGGDQRKHMLTQETGTYVYKVNATDPNTILGLVTANVQTWANSVPVLKTDNSGTTMLQDNTTNGNVWRKKADYSWMPTGTPTADGLTPTGFADFNWTDPAASVASWKKTSEATLYDVYSHGLEETDMNANYAAVKMGYNDSKVLISGSPAKHKELAFSGAEDALIGVNFSGLISKGSGVVEEGTTFPVATAHTGYNSLRVGAGLLGFGYSLPISTTEAGKQYIASVWVKSSTASAPVANIYYQVNSGGAQVPANVVSTRKAGEWYLLSIVTPTTAAVNGNTLIFGCKNAGTANVYFDDFRIRPLNASSNAYVYDELTGALTYILDNNNLFTRYEYDAMGRLIRTFRETFSNGAFKIGEIEYNYGKQLIGNDPQSQGFRKQCTGAGEVGSLVPYPVAANKYFASTKDAANKLALDEIRVKGQAYANVNGSCAVPSVVYVTMFYGNYDNNSAEIFLNFFADDALTVPYSVTNLNVTYKMTRINCDATGTIGNSTTVTCNGSSVSLGRKETSFDDGVHCWVYSYNLVAGAGYVIK